MKINKNLVLFTYKYPGSYQERTFIKNEIDRLCLDYKKLTLIPINNSENTIKEFEKTKRDNCYVDFSLSKLHKNIFIIIKVFLFEIFFDKKLWIEIKKILFEKNKIQNFFILIKQILSSKITKKWILQKYENFDNYIFYSFWANQILLSFNEIKKENNNFKCLTRVLGSDLKGFYENNFYSPFKNFKFKDLDLIIVQSEEQKNIIINENLSKRTNNIFRIPLGIPPQNFCSIQSNDNELIFVSCGSLSANKNNEEILDFINLTSKFFNEKKIIYKCIGKGNAKKTIIAQYEKIKNNFELILIDEVDDLIDFFKFNKTDFFINLSYSEGMAHTILEAMSCSIPIIASNIPANNEIINSLNGYLLKDRSNEKKIKLLEIINKDLINKKNIIKKKVECQKIVNNQLNYYQNYLNLQKALKLLND